MKTLEGDEMTATAATLPVGAALRIAPAFVATTANDATGIETAIEAEYDSAAGRYVLRTIVSRAIRRDVAEDDLRRGRTQQMVQAAVPRCIALQMQDTSDAPWVTVADLTASEGRIIPSWMVSAVVKHGVKSERHDVIEILYGASALAGIPPVKTIALELGVPHRTASDWIKKARAAGRLKGMNYNVGRQADA